MTHSLCFKTFCCRKVSFALVAVIVGLFLSGAATAATSIADSWHNLGSDRTTAPTGTPNGGAIANQSTATAEVCVFCHTPHGGTIGFIVPLWNKVLPTGGTTYTTYASLGTSTFDAQETSIGSISLACLSCHDGTQAIDSVINSPGSGGYNPAGGFIGGAATTSMIGDDIDPATGALAVGIVQNIGTDLTNDHPVSMQYGGGGINVGTPNGPTTDPDFNLPSSVIVNAQTFWWIDAPVTGVTGARDRLDVILYTRTDAAIDSGAAQPFVECGSCHDPHNVENPTFLRISNGIVPGGAFDNTSNDTPSGLCLTCHNK